MVVKRVITEYLEKHKGTIKHFSKPDHVLFLLLLPCILLYAYGFGVVFLALTILLWGAAFVYDLLEIHHKGLVEKVYSNIKSGITDYQKGWIKDIVLTIIVFGVICLVLSQFL